MIQMLEKDFIIVIKSINDLRLSAGKGDGLSLLREQSLKNAKQAFKARQVIDRPDHNLEIKLFLKDVKHHQDRIKKS